jgi:hypothetical protein
MDYQTELIAMSIAVSIVIMLVIVILIIVLCHNSKVNNCETLSETNSTASSHRCGASSPESGFIDDNNLLQVPELYNRENMNTNERRPSISVSIYAVSFIRHTRQNTPKNNLVINTRPTGKPQLPELEF